MRSSYFSLTPAAALAATVLWLAGTAGLRAQLLEYDGFSYSGTALNGQSGGTGWGGSSWSDPNNTTSLPADGLSLSYPVTVSFIPAGNRILSSAIGVAERRLGTVMPLNTEGLTFYCSALVKQQGDFRIQFLDNLDNIRWRFGGGGTTSNAVVGLGFEVTNAGIFPPDKTVFIVAKMFTHATDNDQVYMNIYRAGQIVPTAEPTSWDISGDGFSGVTLTRLQVNNLSGLPLEVDEIRVGTTYASVAGPPVPSGPPVITTGPVSTTVYEGMDVQFQVQATGANPLSYQWQLGGQALAGATDPTLVLTNLAASQSGSYSVQITNSAGSTNSEAAVLTVIPVTNLSVGLHAFWHFDETAGLTAFDVTSNHNDGALVGFPADNSQWVPSYYIRALAFNGADYVELADNSTIGSQLVNRFSVAGWFRSNVPLSADANTYRMLEKENSYFLIQGNGDPASLGIGGINALVKKGGLVFTAAIGQALNANQWYHIAATYDGSNLRIYLDGALKGTAAVAAPIDSTTDVLHIGADHNVATPRFFDGQIDELGIWERPLRPSEILQMSGHTGLPVFLEQPQPQTKIAGATATFSVFARGQDPLYYLWYQGTNAIRGATTTTLTLLNVQPDQAGDYRCLVSNPLGEQYSVSAALTVIAVTNLNDTLQASWKFDDGNGFVASDSSGNSQNGELDGYTDPTTQWISGQVGGALAFDGLTERVVATNSAAMDVGTEATFAFWIRPSSYGTLVNSGGGYNYNLGRVLAKGSQFDIQTVDDPSTVRATIRANGANAPERTLQLDVWQHFTLVFQGGTVSFYKNGFRVGDPAPGSLGALGTDLAVLGNLTADLSADSFFAGAMDEVQIWARPLTEAEILTVAGLDATNAPVIVNQPQSAVRYKGSSVSFAVDATGKRPLTYQWQHNGTPVAGVNANQLVLTNLALADAGNYTVTVGNNLGSVTSAPPAVLTIRQITNVTSGLVAHWPMDETAGSVLHDATGHGHDAVLQNATAAVPGNPGVIGGSFNFDGSQAFAIVSNAPDLTLGGQFSISVWLNPRSVGPGGFNYSRIVRKDINYDFTLFTPFLGSYTILLFGKDKTPYSAPPDSVTIDEWQHFVLVFKDDTIQFFKNGAGLTDPMPGLLGGAVTNDLIIGNYGPNLSIVRLFDGNMDDLGIWNRALSASEIDGIYQNGLLGRSLSAPFEPLEIRGFGSSSPSQFKLVFFSPYTGRQHAIQATTQFGASQWAEVTNVTFTSLGGGLNQAVFDKSATTTAFYRVALLPQPPIFFENFETGAPDWTHGGSGDNWKLGTPVNGPGHAYSGTNAYATSLTGNILPNSDCYLHSPVINLAGVTRATLTFEEWRNVDPDLVFQGTVVNVLDATSQTVIGQLSALAGGTTGYEPRTAALPAGALGRNVIIEFRLYCDSFNLLEGWYIDDVTILPQ
jgi:hypothetical protein